MQEDYVHLFFFVPPKWSPSEIVRVMKSISAKIIFEEFPKVKEQLWVGEFWSEEFFVGIVGDKVTSEVMRNYIKYH